MTFSTPLILGVTTGLALTKKVEVSMSLCRSWFVTLLLSHRKVAMEFHQPRPWERIPQKTPPELTCDKPTGGTTIPIYKMRAIPNLLDRGGEEGKWLNHLLVSLSYSEVEQRAPQF